MTEQKLEESPSAHRKEVMEDHSGQLTADPKRIICVRWGVPERGGGGGKGGKEHTRRSRWHCLSSLGGGGQHYNRKTDIPKFK